MLGNDMPEGLVTKSGPASREDAVVEAVADLCESVAATPVCNWEVSGANNEMEEMKTGEKDKRR